MRPGLILSFAIFLFGTTAGLLLGSGHSLFAQTGTPQGVTQAQEVMGTSFTFQGKLHSGDGPAEGDFEMRFTLFDALEEGNQIGDEITIAPVSVSVDGAFAVRLDFGAGAFDGQARFLQVQVRPQDSEEEFTLLLPRQELTPAVYALFSATTP